METNNDHHNNQRTARAGSIVVRQRAFVASDAKIDPQANGNEKGAASKQWPYRPIQKVHEFADSYSTSTRFRTDSARTGFKCCRY